MMARWLALALCLGLAACAGASPRADTPEPPALELSGDPAEPIRTCKVDADCAVKNVGNCCGYFPACVNRDAPTFPEQVKAACEREGRMAICGFREISACECVEGVCAPASDGAEAL